MPIGILADWPGSPFPVDSDATANPAHIAALAQSLGELGHSVTVYTRRTDADIPERTTRDDGVTIHTVTAGPPRPLPADQLRPHLATLAGSLERAWRRDEPTVLHAYDWTYALAALAARGDAPIVRTFRPRAGALRGRNRDLTRLERAICRDVAHVTVGCTADLDDVTALGMPRNKLTVVPRGVDLDRFAPDGPSYPRGDSPRLLSLGPLAPTAGFDTAIRAVAAIPHAELLLAAVPEGYGDPAEISRLAAIAHRCGVSDRVRLLRRVPNDTLPELIRSVDAVVCVPTSEAAEALAPEAMACGKPVIATERGSLTDVVINDVTGIFVAPAQPEQLATAVRDLLAEQTRLDGYGMTARERISARYSWPRVAAETARVYSTLGAA